MNNVMIQYYHLTLQITAIKMAFQFLPEYQFSGSTSTLDCIITLKPLSTNKVSNFFSCRYMRRDVWSLISSYPLLRKNISPFLTVVPAGLNLKLTMYVLSTFCGRCLHFMYEPSLLSGNDTEYAPSDQGY